ncbi:MAG: TraX family protein [Niameybacter sp.]|uniref:TraX family protein n=1 Tax=Niameybacter sp. TaxID=2033640 RepID=UPI002FCAFE49
MDFIKKGLSGFDLKLFALIFMTFDHVREMLSGLLPIPTWFGIIGRISAPLFIFMVAEGMWHTRNRVKYMGRLYLASVSMALLNNVANTYFPMPNGGMIINNIFATMFLITFFIHFSEKTFEAFKARQFSKAFINLALIVSPIFLSFIFVMNMTTLPLIVLQIVLVALPLPMLVEGGPIWIILGIGFYLCHGNKKRTGIFYVILCVLTFMLSTGMDFSFENLFLINYQWLMILALPSLLLYNGEKGKGMRSFFYIYYPAHLYLLLGVAYIINGLL